MNIQRNQQQQIQSQNTSSAITLQRANELFSYLFISITFNSISTLIFCYNIENESTIEIVSYLIIGKLMLQIFHQSYFYKVFNIMKIHYYQTIIKTIQLILECTFIIFILIWKTNNWTSSIIYSNIILIINLFLAIVLKVTEKKYYFKYSLSKVNLINIFEYIIILIISIFIDCKLEQLFNINWIYTLWIFWLLIAMFSCLIIYNIFILSSYGIQSILEQQSQVKLKMIAYFYILQYLICLTCIIIIIPLTILNVYNFQDNYILLNISRIILIIFNIIFLLFTFYQKNNLLNELQIWLSQYDYINPHQQLATQATELHIQQFKQDLIESQQSELHLKNIPKVVQRISRTYFWLNQTPKQTKEDSNTKHHRIKSSQFNVKNFDEKDKIKLTSMINLNKLTARQSPKIEQNNYKQDEIQNISLSSLNNCCICYEQEPDAIYSQCGHGGICYKCAMDILKQKQECYLCRQKIESVLKIKYEDKTNNKFNVIGITDVKKQNLQSVLQ